MAPAFGQVSLAEADAKDIAVTTPDGEVSVTVFPDARKPTQWYYMPYEPRLVEHQVANHREPEFGLVKFQFNDPEDHDKLVEGAVLQFSATLALPEGVLPQLVEAIAQETGEPPASIHISAVPLQASKVKLYLPTTGDYFVGKDIQGDSIGPVHATQKMAFTVMLDRLGAQFYDQLVRGTGIVLAAELEYKGLVPAVNLTVRVKMDRLHELYSKDSKFRLKASLLPFHKTGASFDRSEFRQKLIDSQIITIEGFAADEKLLDDYLKPIMSAVNDELLQTDLPPELAGEHLDSFLEPAEAEDVKVSPKKQKPWNRLGRLMPKIGSGYSSKVKKFRQEWTKERVLEFDIGLMQERRTLAVGPLGLRQYPEAIRDKLITTVTENGMEAVYFALPDVSTHIGIDRIAYVLTPKRGDEIIGASQTAIWSAERASWSFGSRPRTLIPFVLAGIKDVDGAYFEARTDIYQRLGSTTNHVQIVRGIAMPRGGQLPVAPADQWVDTVEFFADDTSLRWLGDGSRDIRSVDVSIEYLNRRMSASLRPFNNDGLMQAPAPLHILVPRVPDDLNYAIRCDVAFNYGGGLTRRWDDSGRNLRLLRPDLVVNLASPLKPWELEAEWEIDATDLEWNRLDPTGDLVAVEIALSRGPLTYRQTLRPRRENGAFTAPEILTISDLDLVTGETDLPVRADILFRFKAGVVGTWKYDGQDLLTAFPGRYVYLDSTDIVRTHH